MRERIVGAFIVVLYTLLMVLLPKAFYISLVYFLGVLIFLEVLSISKLEGLSTIAVIVYSLIFLLSVDVPKFLTEHFLLSGNFLSAVLISSPAFLFLSLFTYSLLFEEGIPKNLLPSLGFLVYVTFGIVSLALLSKPYFILLISIVWSTDTFAYLVGRFFGRKKLFPSVSPKKTLEGFIGGALFGTVIPYLLSIEYSLFSPGIYTLLLLFFLSMVSQVGDLFESSLKRFFNVKDSGRTIPGHGGVLDRLDSTLAIAPFLYIVSSGG